MADDIRYLSIIIAARVDGGEVHEKNASIPIPPDYDSADTRALIVRKIEDTAFELNREDFGRTPTRDALRAAVARLIGIERILDGPDGIVPKELRIRVLLAASNAEAIEQYGEPDED